MKPKYIYMLSGSLITLAFIISSAWTAGAQPVQQLDRTPVWATQTAEASGAVALATPTLEPAAPAQALPPVAYITLRAAGAPAGAWTVVQWQDPDGGWHDVTGWGGDFETGQQKVWAVFERDWGTGPFRWLVYSARDGAVWGTSDAFTLPGGAGSNLNVAVAGKGR